MNHDTLVAKECVTSKLKRTRGCKPELFFSCNLVSYKRQKGRRCLSEILKRTLVFQPRSQGLFPRKLEKPEKALGTSLSQLYHVGLLCQIISAKFAKQRVLRVALGPFRLFIASGLSTPGGGYSKKNWVGVCGPLLKTLTLIRNNTQTAVTNMTKNCMLENKII